MDEGTLKWVSVDVDGKGLYFLAVKTDNWIDADSDLERKLISGEILRYHWLSDDDPDLLVVLETAKKQMN